MDNKSFDDMIEIIYSYYGVENQLLKSLEEFAELIRILSREASNKNGLYPYSEEDNISNLIDELADAYIMGSQIIRIYDIEEEFKDRVEQKLLREIERIKK